MGFAFSKREYYDSSLTTSPVKWDANDLFSLKIGDSAEQNTGCCPNTVLGKTLAGSEADCKAQGFSYPGTGEFSFSLGSTCNMCGTEYGKECPGLPYYGGRPKLTRIAYNADAYNCCATGARLIGDKTCDPALTPKSPRCDAHMKNFCSQGNNIFTNVRCAEWAGAYPSDAWDVKSSKCGSINEIVSNPHCRKFIVNEGARSADQNMDYEMGEYCKLYPNSSICACINAPQDIVCPNKFYKPCYQNPGYATFQMLRQKCPDIIDCSQQVTMDPASLANISSNMIQQNCTSYTTDEGDTNEKGKTTTTTEKGTTVTDKKPAPVTPAAPTESEFPIWAIMLIIFVILAIVIATILFFVLRKKSPEKV